MNDLDIKVYGKIEQKKIIRKITFFVNQSYSASGVVEQPLEAPRKYE